jgi:hypothetical protein
MRLRLRQWYLTWLGIKNIAVYNPFSSYFSNINRTESYEQNSFNMYINFGLFKNLALLYSRVGAGARAAGAGAASKFLPGAGAA